MGSQSSTKTGWRRAVMGAVTSSTLAVGLLIGTGVGTAQADVLDDIYQEYDTGQGGGQVSNLIHTAMKLRQLGYVPSKGNITDLQAAMDKRPNQVPMITALEQTVAYQKRSQARGAAQVGGPVLNPQQIPGGNMPGFGVDPNQGSTIQIPLGP